MAARAALDSAAERDALDYLQGGAGPELSRLEARFSDISARLEQPLLGPLRWTPVLGRQLDAARHQATATATALQAADGIADRLRPLMDGGFAAGPDRVRSLRAVQQIAKEGRQAFQVLDLGPKEALVSALSSTREELQEKRTEIVTALDDTITASEGMVDFFEGPNDYLMVAANNAQMQNGQGMFLQAGILHVEDGQMDLGPMASLEDVPSVVPPIPLEPDLAARWGWLDPNYDIRHLGLSARFPVTARTASDLWAALGNPEVDGVIAVDAYMLRAITRATGPVQTSQGELESEAVPEYILHGQYQGYLVDGGGDTSYTAERREELDEIARTAVDDLEEIEALEAEFLEEARNAARGRHLLMWSSDPSVQAAFEAVGVDGQPSGSSVLLSLVNRSGVKLDWHMRMAADLTVRPAGDDRYEAVIDIAVTNQAPSSGEPAYVVGPYPRSGIEPGAYLGLVTLTLPGAATDSRFDGVNPLAVSGPDGENRTIAAWVEVSRGTTTHLVARFELPRAVAEVLVEPSARAHPTKWSYDGQEWRDRRGRTLQLASTDAHADGS